MDRRLLAAGFLMLSVGVMSSALVSQDAAESPDVDVRRWLRTASAAELKEVIAEVARGDVEPARERQLWLGFTELGPRAAAVAPSLIAALSAVEKRDRERITILLDAVAAIGPYAADEEVQDLVDLLGQSVAKLIHVASTEYVRAFSRLQISVDSEIDELILLLDEDNPNTREFAAELLRRHGPAATSAVPKLIELRDSSESRAFSISGPNWGHHSGGGSVRGVQRQAALALVAIVPRDAAAIIGYQFMLADPSASERVRAVRRLGEFGSAAASAVAPLRKRLRDDPDPLVVREAITALGMIGPTAAAAVDQLVELSENPDKQIAMRARAALRQIRE